MGEDVTVIREATVALDRSTQRLAELMMDAAVTSAIRGKDITNTGLDDDGLTAPHPMAPAEFK